MRGFPISQIATSRVPVDLRSPFFLLWGLGMLPGTLQAAANLPRLLQMSPPSVYGPVAPWLPLMSATQSQLIALALLLAGLGFWQHRPQAARLAAAALRGQVLWAIVWGVLVNLPEVPLALQSTVSVQYKGSMLVMASQQAVAEGLLAWAALTWLLSEPLWPGACRAGITRLPVRPRQVLLLAAALLVLREGYRLPFVYNTAQVLWQDLQATYYSLPFIMVGAFGLLATLTAMLAAVVTVAGQPAARWLALLALGAAAGHTILNLVWPANTGSLPWLAESVARLTLLGQYLLLLVWLAVNHPATSDGS